jgi:nicotinamide riboside transporter PnuC
MEILAAIGGMWGLISLVVMVLGNVVHWGFGTMSYTHDVRGTL